MGPSQEMDWNLVDRQGYILAKRISACFIKRKQPLKILKKQPRPFWPISVSIFKLFKIYFVTQPL
jgi:hypothetical protein